MSDIVGTDIPTGNEVKFYHGGAQITNEELTEIAGIITLSKKAEFGSVFVLKADGTKTDQMLELDTDGVTPATEADGTDKVQTSAAGTDKMYAYYVDIETTPLTQVAACKDVKTSLAIDNKEDTIQGQVSKLKRVGAASRTADLEELDYNDDFVAAVFGDQAADSPAAGDKKWSDNFHGVHKVALLVGKQIQDGTLKKKYFLIGCQVSKIDGDFPTEDLYAKSFSFMVDYMVSVELA